MNSFFEFLKGIFSSRNELSSKRLLGCILLIVSVIYIGIFDHTLIGKMMYVGAALLGLGLMDGIIKR